MSAFRRQQRLLRAAARKHARARLLDTEAELLVDLAKVEGKLAATEVEFARRMETYR